MGNRIFLVLLVLHVTAGNANYTWHSTVAEFEKMFDEDLAMLLKLEDLIERQSAELEVAKDKLTKLHESVTTSLSHLQEQVMHPVTHLRMFDVISSSEHIPSFKEDVSGKTLMDKLSSFPGQPDRKAVLENLLKIQEIYGLNSTDLARGIILGSSSGHEMAADDCADLGDMACEHNHREVGISWYEETLKLILNGAPSRYNDKIVSDEIELVKDKIKCERLCSQGGEPLGGILKCSMWDNYQDPWLVLQPIKMETLSTAPYIVKFFDVLSDKEIEGLKSLSEAHMKSAKTRGDTNDATVITSPRIAHHTWLNSGNLLVKKIDRRIRYLTGLDLSTSELLQVATYGIGGHYVPHYDWHGRSEKQEYSYLNRKATFMFYLSDVGLGGSTVFLHPGIAVRPEKGSAIFWHNLLDSGFVDVRTRHCACHIIVGTKWVANKWIRETKVEMCKKEEYLGRIR